MDDDSLYQSWGSPKRPEKTQNSKLKMSKRNSTEKLTNPYSMDWSHDNWYDLASFHLLLNDDTLVQFLRHVWQYCDPRY